MISFSIYFLQNYEKHFISANCKPFDSQIVAPTIVHLIGIDCRKALTLCDTDRHQIGIANLRKENNKSKGK